MTQAEAVTRSCPFVKDRLCEFAGCMAWGWTRSPETIEKEAKIRKDRGYRVYSEEPEGDCVFLTAMDRVIRG